MFLNSSTESDIGHTIWYANGTIDYRSDSDAVVGAENKLDYKETHLAYNRLRRQVVVVAVCVEEGITQGASELSRENAFSKIWLLAILRRIFSMQGSGGSILARAGRITLVMEMLTQQKIEGEVS